MILRTSRVGVDPLRPSEANNVRGACEYAAETETGEPETTTCLFARATPVFAAEQIDGYQSPAIDAQPATVVTPIEQAEAFVRATGASISHGGRAVDFH